MLVSNLFPPFLETFFSEVTFDWQRLWFLFEKFKDAEIDYLVWWSFDSNYKIVPKIFLWDGSVGIFSESSLTIFGGARKFNLSFSL